MGNLGRTIFLVSLPVTVLLLLWAWLGRLLFGIGGWDVVILTIVAGPWALLGTGLVAMFALNRPQRPRTFTRREEIALFVVWAGLFGVGLFLADSTDEPGVQASVFTELTGSDSLTLSGHLTTLSGVLAFGGWVALLVLLILDRRGRAPESAEDTQTEADQTDGAGVTDAR